MTINLILVVCTKKKFFVFFVQPAIVKEGKENAVADVVHQIRIELAGCNVRSLEKVCSDLISGAKRQKLRVSSLIDFGNFQKILYFFIEAKFFKINKKIFEISYNVFLLF